MVPMREGSVVRLPLQGGLPPADGVAGSLVAIACDESGFSGTNLLDAATPVITHASVDLSMEEATELVSTLRSGFRFPLHEFKSAQLLRDPRAGRSMERFLAALSGRAHVQVVDKEYFLVTRIVDLLLAEPSYTAGTRLSGEHRSAALALYRARRSGGPGWAPFLAAFVDLVRTKRRRRPDRDALDRFFRARDSLLDDDLGPAAVAVLAELSPDRVRAVVARLAHDDRSIPHRWSRCCRPWPRPCSSGAAGGDGCWWSTTSRAPSPPAGCGVSSRRWPTAPPRRRWPDW
jgi:hypothetical protein